jgi:hypothetical protein
VVEYLSVFHHVGFFVCGGEGFCSGALLRGGVVLSGESWTRERIMKGDAPTRNTLEKPAREEDAHIDWLEEQQDQIKQIGVELYLSNQTKE